MKGYVVGSSSASVSFAGVLPTCVCVCLCVCVRTRRPSSSDWGQKIGQGKVYSKCIKMFNVCCPRERERALTAGNTAHPLYPNVTRHNESIREGMTMQMSNKMKVNTRGFIHSNHFKHPAVTINVFIWDMLSPTCFSL